MGAVSVAALGDREQEPVRSYGGTTGMTYKSGIVRGTVPMNGHKKLLVLTVAMITEFKRTTQARVENASSISVIESGTSWNVSVVVNSSYTDVNYILCYDYLD